MTSIQLETHLSVDLDETLLHDLLGLMVGKRVLETVAEEDHKWEALAQLVRASRRAGSERT